MLGVFNLTIEVMKIPICAFCIIFLDICWSHVLHLTIGIDFYWSTEPHILSKAYEEQQSTCVVRRNNYN